MRVVGERRVVVAAAAGASLAGGAVEVLPVQAVMSGLALWPCVEAGGGERVR